MFGVMMAARDRRDFNPSLRRDRPVGLPVISHHRVQDEGNVRPAGEKFLHDPDLFGASQKAAVNPVKPKAQLLPFRQIIPQVRRTVVHEMDRESGMVGKKGGGYRTDLYLHGADDGNRLGGGAAPIPGDVVDHGYFLRNPAGHVRSLRCAFGVISIFCAFMLLFHLQDPPYVILQNYTTCEQAVAWRV